jgi:hypothetical protein
MASLVFLRRQFGVRFEVGEATLFFIPKVWHDINPAIYRPKGGAVGVPEERLKLVAHVSTVSLGLGNLVSFAAMNRLAMVNLFLRNKPQIF